jgi:hypothetical protein
MLEADRKEGPWQELVAEDQNFREVLIPRLERHGLIRQPV